MYAILSILKQKKLIKRTLVICPVRPMWRVWPNQKNAYADFEHLTVAVAHGANKDETLRSQVDIVCINPEALAWLFASPEREKYVKANFDVLIVDESTYFQNTQSQRFKLLKRVVPCFRRRYILTGSMIHKDLLGLFGQIYILDEGQSLGRYITKFKTEYFYPSGWGGYEWKPMENAEARIIEKIQPLVCRAEISGVVDLPELIVENIFVDLPLSTQTLYKKMWDELLVAVGEGEVVAANAAVASGKCRQIANGGIYLSSNVWEPVHDEKMAALEELLERLCGDPVLITYEFQFDKERIAEKFKIPCISTDNAKKDAEYIDLFSKGLLPAVMGSPKSIALGIDGLQNSCNHIAMFGVPWSLLDYQQTIARVQRSGSKSKHCYLHRILASNTVDERVIKVLENREATQEAFMGLLTPLE